MRGEYHVHSRIKAIFLSGHRYRERSMFQLKPGSMALIIGARTASGRRNVGKSVELFGLCQPGQRFVNPVNGVMTQLPATADRALWLAVTPPTR